MNKNKKYKCELCGRPINHQGNCFLCNIKKKDHKNIDSSAVSFKKENFEKIDEHLTSGAKIYSVDEITTYIKNLLEQDKSLQNFWIKGEISNFRHSNNIHMYFSLKDESSIIECAMFQRANKDLEFAPEDGMKVIIKGGVDVYKLRGRYQIIVEEMYLAGKGELYIKFLQLKAKLEKEGLFKEEHKKPIPKYPKAIGIVTSLQGAVIQDIIKVIKRRYPHVKILIYPSLVQGNEAKYNLVKGIEVLNSINLDIIIIARGGGSFEELWPFNEEIVARAIYDSKTPIISAVGHETDFTIADFVADKRAPTPSVAAEISVPDVREILGLFVHLEKRLCKQTFSILEIKKQAVNQVTSRPVFKKPYMIVDTYKQNIDEKFIKLKQTIINKTEILKREIKGLDGKLSALSPYAILERGYSITMKKDKIISNTKNINRGDIISTIVSGGKINSRVQNKNEEKVV